MPGFVMHLSEATIIAKEWKKIFEKNGAMTNQKFDYEEWERKFLYGALLPDSVQFPGGKDPKKISHFWPYDRSTHVFMVPDISAFQTKYADKLADPISHPVIAGYLAHIHLDQCYFGELMPSLVILEDENGNHTNLRNKIRSVYIKKSGRRIPLNLLFTSSYLYGDYMRLNNMMIDLYNVSVPTYDPQILIDEPIEEVNVGEMSTLLVEMEKYLVRSKFDTPHLQVFQEGITIPFLNDCAEKYFTLFQK